MEIMILKFKAYHNKYGMSKSFGLGHINGFPKWKINGEIGTITEWESVCSIVQYTGLKDKNKKDIYKDHIIKCNPNKIKVTFHNGNLDETWDEMVWPDMYSDRGEIFIVEYDKLTAGFKPFSDYDTDCDVYNNSEYFEIIGNMYENPELLEKS